MPSFWSWFRRGKSETKYHISPPEVEDEHMTIAERRMVKSDNAHYRYGLLAAADRSACVLNDANAIRKLDSELSKGGVWVNGNFRPRAKEPTSWKAPLADGKDVNAWRPELSWKRRRDPSDVVLIRSEWNVAPIVKPTAAELEERRRWKNGEVDIRREVHGIGIPVGLRPQESRDYKSNDSGQRESRPARPDPARNLRDLEARALLRALEEADEEAAREREGAETPSNTSGSVGSQETTVAGTNTSADTTNALESSNTTEGTCHNDSDQSANSEATNSHRNSNTSNQSPQTDSKVASSVPLTDGVAHDRSGDSRPDLNVHEDAFVASASGTPDTSQRHQARTRKTVRFRDEDSIFSIEDSRDASDDSDTCQDRDNADGCNSRGLSQSYDSQSNTSCHSSDGDGDSSDASDVSTRCTPASTPSNSISPARPKLITNLNTSPRAPVPAQLSKTDACDKAPFKGTLASSARAKTPSAASTPTAAPVSRRASASPKPPAPPKRPQKIPAGLHVCTHGARDGEGNLLPFTQDRKVVSRPEDAEGQLRRQHAREELGKMVLAGHVNGIPYYQREHAIFPSPAPLPTVAGNTPSAGASKTEIKKVQRESHPSRAIDPPWEQTAGTRLLKATKHIPFKDTASNRHHFDHLKDRPDLIISPITLSMNPVVGNELIRDPRSVHEFYQGHKMAEGLGAPIIFGQNAAYKDALPPGSVHVTAGNERPRWLVCREYEQSHEPTNRYAGYTASINMLRAMYTPKPQRFDPFKRQSAAVQRALKVLRRKVAMRCTLQNLHARRTAVTVPLQKDRSIRACTNYRLRLGLLGRPSLLRSEVDPQEEPAVRSRSQTRLQWYLNRETRYLRHLMTRPDHHEDHSEGDLLRRVLQTTYQKAVQHAQKDTGAAGGPAV